MAMSATESAGWLLTAISCFCVLGSLEHSLLLLGLLPFVGGVAHRWLLPLLCHSLITSVSWVRQKDAVESGTSISNSVSNTSPSGRHWGWHFQVLQSYFQGTCLGLFMCSGLGPAVEACAEATVQPHNPYCVGPAMCTLP